MEFAELTLDAIEPSLSNPRRHRSKLEDADLMASISTHGNPDLTPLLVRPMPEPGKYQIAAAIDIRGRKESTPEHRAGPGPADG